MCGHVLKFVFLVALCYSLFLKDNTPTGRMDRDKSTPGNWIDENGNPMDESKASTSWWILFILVRANRIGLCK